MCGDTLCSIGAYAPSPVVERLALRLLEVQPSGGTAPAAAAAAAADAAAMAVATGRCRFRSGGRWAKYALPLQVLPFQARLDWPLPSTSLHVFEAAAASSEPWQNHQAYMQCAGTTNVFQVFCLMFLVIRKESAELSETGLLALFGLLIVSANGRSECWA